MGILTILSFINTIVWTHPIGSNEIFEEKAWKELHKDATHHFEQILEVAPEKTTAVWSLTSHLTNQKWERHAGHCWWNKDEFISDIVQWTPTHGHTSISQWEKTYIHQFCIDTGYYLEDQARAMTDRNGW